MFVKGDDATVRAATYDKIKEKCAIVKEGGKGWGLWDSQSPVLVHMWVMNTVLY